MQVKVVAADLINTTLEQVNSILYEIFTILHCCHPQGIDRRLDGLVVMPWKHRAIVRAIVSKFTVDVHKIRDATMHERYFLPLVKSLIRRRGH